MSLDVLSIAGARPNFMKVAPLDRAFAAHAGVRHRILHTGQHYDRAMSELFFDELGLPKPWRNLEVGSATHAVQTAQIMLGVEKVFDEDPPELLLVVGDVNSTVGAALVAVKRGIPVAHVEAGLRSFDRTMPEEINRIVTDSISDVLLVSEPSGMVNLKNEGVAEDRVFLTGNVMIDTLLYCRDRARQSTVLEEIGVAEKGYGVVTLHRPSNVDDENSLRGLLGALSKLSEEVPLVFPVHPRTRARLAAIGHDEEKAPGLRLVDPKGYLDFLRLMEGARIILSDSGGIQEEACILGVPCLTLRENTERPVTIEVGMNRLVGNDPERVLSAGLEVLRDGSTLTGRPELWDGKAAERIAQILVTRYG